MQVETLEYEGPVKIVDVGVTEKHCIKGVPNVQLQIICISAMETFPKLALCQLIV